MPSLAFEPRTYNRPECVVFLKTKELWGELSNMAADFPIRIHNVKYLTAEALYQACRFPHLPEVQQLIIDQASPMVAKMKSKPYRSRSRVDWDSVRVEVMRWCLQMKLAQHYSEFGRILLATKQRDIVEQSARDPFWGAKETSATTLHGQNVLGHLLVDLREKLKVDSGRALTKVPVPTVPNMLFFGRQIV